MEEGKDINQPGYKPRFVSEYSMGSLDFARYNEWLKYIEHWGANINSTEVPTLDMVQHYFAGLNVLYKSWRAIIAVKSVVKEIDEAIEEVKKLKRVWENSVATGLPYNKVLIQNIVDKLDKIHTKLMDIKQKIGLGIVVRQNIGTKEKIKKGMGQYKDKFVNLPVQ